ncbi:MAG: aminotransferase class V-fold PLP-dependent enzyme [Elusimicrobia bacterium]|nr:aminotransferase class V-fold PLP-dependent enzyme [Elusimicrobiota bacterium]
MQGKKNILPFKKEFPALNCKILKKSMVYLDSACTALKMKSAAIEQSDFLLKFGACAGKRSAHLLSREVENEFCAARKTIALFIGAKNPQEIIFTSGATEAANMVAASFPFKKGDEVILSSLEHNSVFLPFYRLSKQGKIKLRIIPLKDFKLDFDAYKKMLNAKTALVCITRASNIFGGVVHIKKFINTAHKNGAKVFVDDAQYIPTHKENVSVLNADMMAFSGHKIGASFGIGVLYIKKNLFKFLRPSKLGGGTVKNIIYKDGLYKVDFLDYNAVYEAGIQNYSGIAALKKSFELLSKIGYKNIRAHIQDIVGYAYLKLSSFKEIKIIGSRKDLEEGSIISFVCESTGFSIVDFNIFLNEYSSKYFVAVRCGRHCADLAILNSGIKETVRLSFFIYSSKRDIDIFSSALKLYLKALS